MLVSIGSFFVYLGRVWGRKLVNMSVGPHPVPPISENLGFALCSASCTSHGHHGCGKLTCICNSIYTQYTIQFFLALAIGDPLAKVPYARLKRSNVIGLPSAMHLRHPSAMTYNELELLYQNMG